MALNRVSNAYIESLLTESQQRKLPLWRERAAQAVVAREAYEKENGIDVLGPYELSKDETQLVESEYEKQASNAANNKEMLVFVGPIASGKTSLIKNYTSEDFIHVSVDTFSSQMEGFDGGFGSAAVGRRAGAMMNSLCQKAGESGKKIVMEISGNKESLEIYSRNLDFLTKICGYSLEFVHVDIEPEEAVRRSMKRFEKAADSEEPRRFNDPIKVYNRAAIDVDSSRNSAHFNQRHGRYIDSVKFINNTAQFSTKDMTLAA